MSWFQPEIKHRHVFMLYNIQKDSVQSQLQSFPQNPPPAPLVSSNAETSPAMLFIIVILAIIFFISGLLHLLARFIMRYRPSSSDFPANPDMSNSGTFQRQLHHLFNLHDSGLDQEFIDALPVFQYKEILGLKEPFDCAVCLCEFSEQDKLRLLPLCSHAFHVECIDTWLLSNSTCPLCRGALYTPGLNTKNPVFNFKDWREEDGALGLPSNGGDNCGITIDHKPNEEEIVVEKRKVFSIILGKYRSSSDEGNGRGLEDRDAGESSSNNLYARRCFSMGSYQYVVADSELQVALSSNQIEGNGDQRIFKARAGQWRDQSSVDEDFKGKKISAASKNESFSVSKIWLWSKKDRFCGSSNTHIGDHASENPVVTSFTWRNVT